MIQISTTSTFYVLNPLSSVSLSPAPTMGCSKKKTPASRLSWATRSTTSAATSSADADINPSKLLLIPQLQLSQPHQLSPLCQLQSTSRALSQTRSPRSPEITASYLVLISSSGGLELGRRTCGWFRRFLPFFEEIQDV